MMNLKPKQRKFLGRVLEKAPIGELNNQICIYHDNGTLTYYSVKDFINFILQQNTYSHKHRTSLNKIRERFKWITLN